MSAIHSKLSVVKLDNASGVLTNISTYCNKCEMPQELAEHKATTFGAGSYDDFIAGFASGTVSLGGPWSRALDQHMAPIFEAFKAGTLTTLSFEYGPEGSDSGDVKKTCELSMLNYSGPMASVDGPQEWEAEFRIKAPGVTEATY